MRLFFVLIITGFLTSYSHALPPGAANWQKECENGKAQSCYFFAAQNANGDQIPKNVRRAAEFGFKACNLGIGEACRLAGMSVTELQGPSASRAFYQKGCDGGDQPSCDYIKDLNRYETQVAENNRIYAAQIAQKEVGASEVTQAINAGDYNRAMEIATYGIGDRAQVSRVVLEADRAGRLSNIDPFYFSFLETWLAVDYQQANTIVRREYLKNPNGTRSSEISNRGIATIGSAPIEPSLDDQFWKNQKNTHRRQLDWANRGGNPAGFEVKSNY
ncbi:MAG: hypothetical protein K9G26_04700 [Emcibacter sp.]|nr:hypothetical protein [Emcibacter sp.]